MLIGVLIRRNAEYWDQSLRLAAVEEEDTLS
jgi:hypothetical protein